MTTFVNFQVHTPFLISHIKEKIRNIISYLHHQENRVQNNENHNEVLKRSRYDHSPDFVLEAIHFLWHVSLKRLSLNGKINARFLKRKKVKPELLNVSTQSTVMAKKGGMVAKLLLFHSFLA